MNHMVVLGLKVIKYSSFEFIKGHKINILKVWDKKIHLAKYEQRFQWFSLKSNTKRIHTMARYCDNHTFGKPILGSGNPSCFINAGFG